MKIIFVSKEQEKSKGEIIEEKYTQIHKKYIQYIKERKIYICVY